MCRKTEKVESKKEIAADDEGGLGSMAAAVGFFFVFSFFSAVQWVDIIKKIKEQQINKHVQFRSNKNLFM